MFGFKKKEKKPLMIMAKDVVNIMKWDYDHDMAFLLIEFAYHGQQYMMGSCVLPEDAEERKENISFVFQEQVFRSFEEFQSEVYIEHENICQLEEPIEILRAGIMGQDVLLKTPWGDTRLADKAVNK